MKDLRLFKVSLGFAKKPYFLAVEALDFGDAQARAFLVDSRVPTSIEDLSDEWRLVTHMEVIDIQSQREVSEALRDEDERAF